MDNPVTVNLRAVMDNRKGAIINMVNPKQGMDNPVTDSNRVVMVSNLFRAAMDNMVSKVLRAVMVSPVTDSSRAVTVSSQCKIAMGNRKAGMVNHNPVMVSSKADTHNREATVKLLAEAFLHLEPDQPLAVTVNLKAGMVNRKLGMVSSLVKADMVSKQRHRGTVSNLYKIGTVSKANKGAMVSLKLKVATVSNRLNQTHTVNSRRLIRMGSNSRKLMVMVNHSRM